MKITELLRERFISCGQILPAFDIADIIADYEKDQQFRLDDKTIFTAIYDASDEFVDAMQENAFDTWKEQGREGKEHGMFESEDAFLAYLAFYEATRPRNVRTGEIVKMLSL